MMNLALRRPRQTRQARGRSVLGLALGLVVWSTAPTTAQAEPSGWAYIGAGAVGWQGGERPELEIEPTMVFDVGLGSEPMGPLILGGMLRVQPLFGEGIDLALAARAATSGFQTSLFGVALDLGGYQRFWTPESTGLYGQAVVGGPFGLQVAFQGQYGTNDSYSLGATAGIDFARMILSRDYLLDWWPNPKPYESRAGSPAGLPVGLAQGIPLRF